VRAADAAMRARTDVDVHVDAPEEVTVLADRQRLRQAVGNLLDNALRYAPPGSSVTVRLRSETRPPGPLAVIEVADRGVGFAEQFQPRAFERFERGDHPDQTYDGNGLGLAIARSLARAHGGDAVAMNQPGGGALVRLELPMTASEPSGAELS
jgi:signal transduction histidine kinase